MNICDFKMIQQQQQQKSRREKPLLFRSVSFELNQDDYSLIIVIEGKLATYSMI